MNKLLLFSFNIFILGMTFNLNAAAIDTLNNDRFKEDFRRTEDDIRQRDERHRIEREEEIKRIERRKLDRELELKGENEKLERKLAEQKAEMSKRS